MILSVIALLMIILIAAFWTYQGLFSALIMLIETVIACMLAFGFYESVNSIWGGSAAMRDVGPSLSLMLVFLISLAAMRFLSDKLIPDAVNFPLQVDRAGSAACGFLTGMTLVGTALVAIQMFPFGSSVLGFSRFEFDADGKPVRKSLLISPDGFTLGMVQVLSNGRFGGGSSFGLAKPDMLGDLYWAHNGPQREAGVAVPPGCLNVQACWEAKQINKVEQQALAGSEMKRAFKTEEPVGLNKFLVCRVTLDSTAAFPAESGDIRFRVSQFRVVGPPPAPESQSSASPEVFPACGMSDLYLHKDHNMKEVKPDQPQKLVRWAPTTDFLLNPTVAKVVQKDGNKYQFDVAFEVPEAFEPWYVEFKQGARAEVAKSLMKKEAPGAIETAAAAPSDKPAEAPKAEGDKPAEKKIEVGAPPPDRVHVADAVKERTAVSSELPLVLNARDKPVANFIRRQMLGECHIAMELTDKEPPPAYRVSEFEVPVEKRMVQVGAVQNMPESVYGAAMNYAAKTVAQISVKTSDDRQYFAVGMYVAAFVNNKWIYEIQYWPTAEIPERCLREARVLKPNILKQVKPEHQKLGYIFLVDPGVEIVRFSTGGKGAGQKMKISVPG